VRNKGCFLPGKSGNPGGRPAVVKEVRVLAQEHTADAISCLVGIIKDKKAPAQARVAASSAILDRGYGKPPQSFDGDGAEGLIVTILKLSSHD
jgi:hypothetical protein